MEIWVREEYKVRKAFVGEIDSFPGENEAAQTQKLEQMESRIVNTRVLAGCEVLVSPGSTVALGSLKDPGNTQ